MIVVDANIIAYFYLRGGKTELARQLREVEPHWVAPVVWRHEFANVLVSSCLFAGLQVDAARLVWEEAVDMMQEGEYIVDMCDVISTAVDAGATAYDIEYVILARRLGVPCVTEDGPLRKAFPADTVSMESYLGRSSGPGLARERRAPYSTRRKK